MQPTDRCLHHFCENHTKTVLLTYKCGYYFSTGEYLRNELYVD